MLSKLLFRRLIPQLTTKKIVVLKDYYKPWRSYFKFNYIQEITAIEESPAQWNADTDSMTRRSQIEDNQILYAKMLTEKLMKVSS